MKPERPVRVFIGVNNDVYGYRVTNAEADGLFVRAYNYQGKSGEQDAGIVRVTMKQIFKSSDSVIRTAEYFMTKENEVLLREAAGKVQSKSVAQQNEKTRFEKSAKAHGKRIDKQERRIVKRTLKHVK